MSGGGSLCNRTHTSHMCMCVPCILLSPPASRPHSSCGRMTPTSRPELLPHRTQLLRALITEFLHNAVDTVDSDWHLAAALSALIPKQSHSATPHNRGSCSVALAGLEFHQSSCVILLSMCHHAHGQWSPSPWYRDHTLYIVCIQTLGM